MSFLTYGYLQYNSPVCATGQQHSAGAPFQGVLQCELAGGPVRGNGGGALGREGHPSRYQPWTNHAHLLKNILPALQQC